MTDKHLKELGGSGSTSRELSLDGLRGVAVLLILLCHLYQKNLIQDTWPTLSLVLGRLIGFGRVGTSIFLFLTGFLITSILLRSIHRPGAIATFFVRRALRILPLYFLVLTAVFFVLPYFVPLDAPGGEIASRQGWLWTFCMTLSPSGFIWDESRLFSLGHFWTLSVEWQFCLVWPFVLRHCNESRLLPLTAGLFLLSLFSRVAAVFIPFLSSSPFILLHRLDGMALGAFTAILIYRPSSYKARIAKQRLKPLICSAAFVSIVLFALPGLHARPLVNALIPSATLVLIALVCLHCLRARNDSPVKAFLRQPVLLGLAKYSYGIYAFHGALRPLFARVFNLTELPTHAILPPIYVCTYYVATISTSVLLGYLSYHLFEKHWLRLKDSFDYAKIGSRSRGASGASTGDLIPVGTQSVHV